MGTACCSPMARAAPSARVRGRITSMQERCPVGGPGAAVQPGCGHCPGLGARSVGVGGGGSGPGGGFGAAVACGATLVPRAGNSAVPVRCARSFCRTSRSSCVDASLGPCASEQRRSQRVVGRQPRPAEAMTEASSLGRRREEDTVCVFAETHGAHEVDTVQCFSSFVLCRFGCGRSDAQSVCSFSLKARGHTCRDTHSAGCEWCGVSPHIWLSAPIPVSSTCQHTSLISTISQHFSPFIVPRTSCASAMYNLVA